MRTKHVLLAMVALGLGMACAGQSKPGPGRQALLEQSLESALASGTVVLRPLSRISNGEKLSPLAPTSFLVDGLGTIVIARIHAASAKHEDPGACSIVHKDGTAQTFPCPDAEIDAQLIVQAVAFGNSALVTTATTAFFVGPDAVLPSPSLPVGGAYGRSLQASTIIRAEQRGTTGAIGISVQRLQVSSGGVTTSEVLLDLANAHSTAATPIWVEETSPGKVSLLYWRGELVYLENGVETVLADGMAGPTEDNPFQVHRTDDGTFWFGREIVVDHPFLKPFLIRWNPSSGQGLQNVEVPDPSAGYPSWIGHHGFFSARSQIVTPNPYAAELDIPNEYETRGFTGSAVARQLVATTPCSSRAECRSLGESYLIGVVGMEATARAIYAVWSWEGDYIGYYMTPLRPPDADTPDAGVIDSAIADTSTDSSTDSGEPVEARSDGEADASSDAGTGEQTLASGLNSPINILVQDEYLYFSAKATGSNYYIGRLAKAGGAPDTIVADAGVATKFVADSSYLYFATNTSSGESIQAIPLAGGSPVILAGEYTDIMAVHDGWLYYWLSGAESLNRSKVQTQAVEQVSAAPSTPGWNLQSIVADSNYAYLGYSGTYKGSVRRAALPSGSLAEIQTTGTSLMGASYMVVNDANLYVRGGGYLGWFPKQGGAYASLATTLKGDRHRVVLRGDSLITADKTKLVSYSKTTGDPTIVVQQGVVDFALDSASVYWTDGLDPGRIRRKAIP